MIVVAVATPTAAQAQAEIFASPLVGYDFGGDAGCPRLNNCKDKRVNTAVSVGAMASLYGLEEEMSYVPDFFGHAPGLSSSIFTLMINGMIIPRVGSIRPYALAGLGLIRTHQRFTTNELLATTDSDFGWNAGGGVMGLIGEHFGVRGDLRYYRSAEDTTVIGFTLADRKLNYWRVGAGVVFRFGL